MCLCQDVIKDVSTKSTQGNTGKVLPYYQVISFYKMDTMDILFFNFIGVELIYNVVLVSGVQQSDSVIRIHISTLF